MRSDALLKAKDRIARAERAANDAASEVTVAKDAYRWQQLARRRVNDIMTVLNARFGGQEVRRDFAEPYVRALIFALMWEQSNRLIAARFVANSFPNFSLSELIEVADNAYAMSSQDVARLLGVRLEERRLLGLSMIGACDLKDEEYSAYLENEDKKRRAARKRLARPRNLDARRIDEQANRDALEALATAEGKSVRTIRRWIAEGKLAGVSISRPHSKRYRGDATLPSSKSGTGERASSPRKPRASKPDVQAEKKAATSEGRDLDSKNTHLNIYGTNAEIGRTLFEAFIALKGQITEPVTRALASNQNGSLARAAGPRRAPGKAVGS